MAFGMANADVRDIYATVSDLGLSMKSLDDLKIMQN